MLSLTAKLAEGQKTRNFSSLATRYVVANSRRRLIRESSEAMVDIRQFFGSKGGATVRHAFQWCAILPVD